MTDKKTIKPFYIKYEDSMTDEVVQEVLDKAVEHGVTLDEVVKGCSQGRESLTPSKWAYFGVDGSPKTYFSDKVENFDSDDTGEFVEKAALITLDQVDYFLEHGCVQQTESAETSNVLLNPHKSSCGETSPSNNTIASDEDNNVLDSEETPFKVGDVVTPNKDYFTPGRCHHRPNEKYLTKGKCYPIYKVVGDLFYITDDDVESVHFEISDASWSIVGKNLSGDKDPLKQAVEDIDEVLTLTTPLSLKEITSLTTTHPLMSFTFINGKCELEYNETIYNVDKDEDVRDIIEAVETLDKYKSEEG